MTDSNRYDGKPFLRFLDCFVLDAIGCLDDGINNTLQVMEPKLASIFCMQGSWQEIVVAQMDFPDEIRDKIRTIWENGSAKAREMDLQVDPNEFARQFVDTNFAPQD